MSDPVTAYMVTEGEYSDYGVRAVFELRADAETAQQAGLGDDVAEIRFFPAGAPLPTKLLVWHATCYLGHDNYDETVRAFSRERWTSDYDLPPANRAVVTEWRTPSGGSVSAEARSEELARKACVDRAAKLRAEALEPGIAS